MANKIKTTSKLATALDLYELTFIKDGIGLVSTLHPSLEDAESAKADHDLEDGGEHPARIRKL